MNSLTRDQLVVGIKNKKVRVWLLREDELMFEKAIQTCQATEQIPNNFKNQKNSVHYEIKYETLNKIPNSLN